MPTDIPRIDVHHHIVPDEYVTSLSKIGVTKSLGLPSFPKWSTETSLEMMDRNGIKAAITSISAPGIYFGDKSFARDLARSCNEISARLVNGHPDRFGAFAVLPLPDIEASIQEIKYALEILKLDGIALLTNYDGTYLGDTKLEDLFKELNLRKSVVYVHPADPPGKNLLGAEIPNLLMEATFDTTRAIFNLIFSGTLERYPDIKFIFAHAGGTVPFIAWRISLGTYAIAGAAERAPKSAITYLENLYYDTGLSASPYALRSLQELVDNSHILFGTDLPFAPEPLTVETIKGLETYNGFTVDDLKAVYHKNALQLFPRFKLN